MKKIVKLLIGLLFLPLCWAGSRAVWLLLIAFSPELPDLWPLWIGITVSVLGFLLLPPAVRTYVLGHEMTHALASLLMGGKVGKMKVGRTGGHVELSKSNFIISLAPYFFPFYTSLVVALWYGLGCFFNMGAYEALWLGLVGLTWGFHIVFTLFMLSQHQPDIHDNGRLFSYTVIYLVNLVVVALWIVLIGDPTLKEFCAMCFTQTLDVYQAVWTAVLSAWNQLLPILARCKP